MICMCSLLDNDACKGPLPEQSGGTEPKLHMGFHSQALTATVQNSSWKKRKQEDIIKQFREADRPQRCSYPPFFLSSVLQLVWIVVSYHLVEKTYGCCWKRCCVEVVSMLFLHECSHHIYVRINRTFVKGTDRTRLLDSLLITVWNTDSSDHKTHFYRL